MLRAVQVGLTVADLDLLEYGEVIDLLTERHNDDQEYPFLATQEDMDRL